MDSLPLSRVVNSQPEGIGRVVSLSGGCAWSNLGRNVVFADQTLRPTAVFGSTSFPDDDEASQFDLDVHAIVELEAHGPVAVLNHLGSLRIFDPPDLRAPLPGDGPDLTEARHLEFVDDVERVTGLGSRLLTSQPRGRRLGGVLVTEPVCSAHETVAADTAHESFGFVTALAADASSDGSGWAALGGDGHVCLVDTDRGQLGAAARWEAAVDFLVATILVSGSTLWAAGSDRGGAGLDDYDWEQLRGGGLAQLDLASGAVIASARFGADLAWGSGGVPVVLIGGLPCGIDRHGALHVLPPGAASTVQLTNRLAPDPLGIAHAAVVGDTLLFGFNRGGYRLHTVPARAITERIPPKAGRRA